MTPSDAIFWWGFACGLFAAILASCTFLLSLVLGADISDADLPPDYGDVPHVPERHGRQTRAKGVRYDRDSFARPTLPGGR